MTVNYKLSDIDLGSIDGEEESSSENFSRLFYTQNSKYSDIMKRSKFIISGRKGTGKTILANYIVKELDDEKNTISKIFNKSDFNLQKLIDLDYRDLKTEEMSLFWKWFFLLQIAKNLLALNTWKSKIPFLIEKKLKNFLDTKYPDDIFKLKDFSQINSSKHALKSQHKKSGSQINGEAESSSSKSKNYIHKEYYELLEILENLVFQSLEKKSEVFLIFDDLDELDEELIKDSYYFKMIKSLIETVKDLNLKFNRIKKKNTKIIILLRSDILETIHEYSSNSNKFVTLGETRLYWIAKDYQHPADHELMDLILHKIQNSVPYFKDVDKKTIYKTLFPKKIARKEVIDYLLNYSFGRPRDVIRYLQLIIIANGNATYFDPSYFKECAKDYSKWFYQELLNEISIRPNKNEIIDGIKLIKNIKKLNMSYTDINDFYELQKSDYPHIQNLKKVLKELFQLGVIGNTWVHSNTAKGANKYRYSWGYRDDSPNDPDFSNNFVVHYGLKKFFS